MSNLFVSGNILYVKDYHFNDGSVANKIMIIVHTVSNSTFIIQAKTTSQIKVPDSRIKHGCTKIVNHGMSFYMFEGDRVIGTNPDGKDFKFDKHTFVHFRDNVSIVSATSYLRYFGSNVKLLGLLEEKEYKRLVKCICKSHQVKRIVKKALNCN